MEARVRLLLAAVALALALSVAACDDDDDSGGDSGETTEVSVSGSVGTGATKAGTARAAFEGGSVAAPLAPDKPVGSDLQVQNAQTIDQWLTAVLGNVHAYWVDLFVRNNYPQPTVNYLWLAPGTQYQTACVDPATNQPDIANDDAVFYCPGDDTIYIAQVAASELWSGTGPLQEWVAGDFGLAYALAHEYGHNVQDELRKAPQPIYPRELQADCFSGNWGASASLQGLLDPGDIEEGINTAYDIGTYDIANPSFHGTPEERAAAWQDGFNSGDPLVCDAYFP
jgi:predicted metalloprotease